MKLLTGSMISAVTSGMLILGVWTLPARGQGENPPASTKASGETSGRGYTLVEQASPNAEREIRSLHEEFRRAALNGDAGFLKQYLADNYVGVSETGAIITKDQAIRDFTSGAVKYDSIDERDTQIRTFGNTAIVDSLASVRLTSNGKPISGEFRASFVWVRQNGNWKRVAFQATRVTPEGQ